jgi:hypothetical protein
MRRIGEREKGRGYLTDIGCSTNPLILSISERTH